MNHSTNDEQVAKKLVSSDFKAGKVEDPTKISEKHEQKVKKHCKDFFDKAAAKHKAYEKKKAEKRAKAEKSKTEDVLNVPLPNGDVSPAVRKEEEKEEETDEEDVKMSEDEDDKENIANKKSSPLTPSINGDSLKRKRDDINLDIQQEPDGSDSPNKKIKSHSPPPPPPPPPAPPVETPTDSAHDSPFDAQPEQETSFKSKSMADVLASAQQDCDEDMSMTDIKAEEAEAHAHLDGANSGLRNGISCKQEVDDPGSVGDFTLNGERTVR